MDTFSAIAVLREWFHWRDAVPVLLNVGAGWCGLLAAGRTYTASRAPAGTDLTELNRNAAFLGAIGVSLQAIAYCIEKAIAA